MNDVKKNSKSAYISAQSIKHQTINKPQKGRKWGNSLLETSLRHNIKGNCLGHTISSLPVEEIDYGTNEL